MRVLVVTNMYPTEQEPGFGSFVHEQVLDLRAIGFEVSVYAFDGRRDKLNYLRAAWAVHRLARRRYFDVIHAHYGLAGAVAALQRRVPVVTTFHGSDAGYIKWQTIVSRLVARATTPIVVNPACAAALGVRAAKVIPVGVDEGFFTPGDREAARARLGLATNVTYLLFPASRQRDVKNPRLFDAVVRELLVRGIRVIGLSLENRTRLEVRDLMRAADLLLMVSKYEGSPVVIKEALACCLPIVSVDVGDVQAIVRGLRLAKVAGGDVTSIADTVQEVLTARSCVDAHELRERAMRYRRTVLVEALADQLHAVADRRSGIRDTLR